VATKKPNAWGLYDMGGNVWQWLQRLFLQLYFGKPDKSDRRCNGKQRCLRGGSWTQDNGLVYISSAGRDPGNTPAPRQTGADSGPFTGNWRYGRLALGESSTTHLF